MATELKVGDRVCKGPTWEWGDQGGKDPKGTVTVESIYDDDQDLAWVTVLWDNGKSDNYRVGSGFEDVIPYREARVSPPTISSSPKKTKLIINGHARHGKDFLADHVADATGLVKLNASMWFAEKVLLPAFPQVYPCVEAAYLDRVNRREMWYQMMRLGGWQQEFMKHSDVFSGHRNIEEHQKMVSQLGPENVLRVWIRWEGKDAEAPASSQWQSFTDIEENHDVLLTHHGNRISEMVATVKEAMERPPII